MNKITLHNVGKKFNRDWIFRNISIELNAGDQVAITGYNGSGKSTLLQIMAGYISASEGRLNYLVNEKEIEQENLYKYLSFSSPYYDLIDEFTLDELFAFCFQFKKASGNKTIDELVELTELTHARKKRLKNFSSGMKQRVKLTLALSVDVPFVFLDEPASNLDKKAVEWFRNLLYNSVKDKIILICSNSMENEITSCNKNLSVESYLSGNK